MTLHTDHTRPHQNLIPYEIHHREIASAASYLADYNVTEAYIREQWKPEQYQLCFGEWARCTLVFLVSGNNPDPTIELEYPPALPENLRLSPAAAFKQINGLCSDQLNALHWLYGYGLRAQHLKAWRDDKGENTFMYNHFNALKALVIHDDKPIKEAISLLHGKSEAEAREMWRKISLSLDESAKAAKTSAINDKKNSYAIHEIISAYWSSKERKTSSPPPQLENTGPK